VLNVQLSMSYPGLLPWRRDDRTPGAAIASTSDAFACEIRHVQSLVAGAGWPGQVLPTTQFTRFHGYPVVQWSAALRDRLLMGEGPELDRPTLSLWESWPAELPAPPPAAPLSIVGFVSFAPWRRALIAASEVRGFGAAMVLVSKSPSPMALAEADVADVWVVRSSLADGGRVLVTGRTGPCRTARRTVATRYWEERMLAHAITAGVLRLRQRSG